MHEIKRRYVIPGDKIAEGTFRPLMNVIKSGNALIATRIGIAETGRDGVKVIPLSGVYIPRVNDLVIGKIVDHSSLSWEVDINSCFSAHLPAQDVFGRDFSPARVNLAARAIRMVEEEAHTANLTQRIKGVLKVPDPPPPQKRSAVIASAI